MKKRFWIGIITITVLLSGCFSNNEEPLGEVKSTDYATMEAQQGNRMDFTFDESNMSIISISAANGTIERSSNTKYYYTPSYIGNSDKITVDYIDSVGDRKIKIYNVN